MLSLMLENITIRPASSDDVQAIAQLSIQTFQDTFATEENKADTDLYLENAFSIQQLETELSDRHNTFLLAYADGAEDPVGYAKLRLGKKASCITAFNPIELERLYVDKHVIGEGLGSRLMQACLNRADAQNHDVLWLGVWEHNQRAIRFYAKWKFVTVGSHLFKLGNEKQTDLIMQRFVVGGDGG